MAENSPAQHSIEHMRQMYGLNTCDHMLDEEVNLANEDVTKVPDDGHGT